MEHLELNISFFQIDVGVVLQIDLKLKISMVPISSQSYNNKFQKPNLITKKASLDNPMN